MRRVRVWAVHSVFLGCGQSACLGCAQCVCLGCTQCVFGLCTVCVCMAEFNSLINNYWKLWSFVTTVNLLNIIYLD